MMKHLLISKLMNFFKKMPRKYMALGWDKKNPELLKGKPKRHYRFFINKPLEESEFLDVKTFDEFDIVRGRRIHKENLFASLMGHTHPPKVKLE
jgi:hypothetical protein